jgi:hypothetical protein
MRRRSRSAMVYGRVARGTGSSDDMLLSLRR